MIVSSASDYREAARRSLPRFLFEHVDGGANAEQTMKANIPRSRDNPKILG